MIRREDITQIGQFRKPHGIKGELSFTFTNDVFDGSDCLFFICEIDGIFVPFSIEGYRIKSDTTAFVKLKGIGSEDVAQKLAGLPIYFSNDYIPDVLSDNDSFSSFIGYSLEDIALGRIGEIVDMEDSTDNILFVVANENHEYLIPATEDWIVGVNSDSKILQVELPEGLIEI